MAFFNKMKKILKVVANVYLVLFVIYWLYVTFNIFLDRSFAGVQEALSPVNVTNWIAILILLSPYLILVVISGKVKPKNTN